MKQLTLIVGMKAAQDMIDQLRMMEPIHGFTLSHVQGHGEQNDNDPFLSARDKVVGYSPRARIDVVLTDDDLKPVLNALRELKEQGLVKSSYYWVLPVEESGRL
ncbi:MAG TPA: DUF3240 domain-containing protein [Ghiorsea sp.]|nr:DUF3240 domain-containing protein [Ghiorsea sp.]HIP06767.1 DUF3240 domain-containing protein [Mariprofundaceae bacterium]